MPAGEGSYRNRRALIGMGAALVIVVAACADGVTDGTTSTTPGSAAPSTASTSAGTGGETVTVDVYLVDQEAFNEGVAPYVVAVPREAPAADPMRGALEALFTGPTPDEANEGLLFVSSGASGIADFSVEGGIAHVTLDGGCNSGGSTLTIAAEIVPTLRQFDGIEAVKIYDPEGSTEDPDGADDSIPECLEP